MVNHLLRKLFKPCFIGPGGKSWSHVVGAKTYIVSFLICTLIFIINAGKDMFHFSHVSVRSIVATCRARTCRIVVLRITLGFHGSNPDVDGAEEARGAAGDAFVPATQSATSFFHIGSCHLYRPLRFAVVPCVTKNKIEDEFINFAGVSHPLNRFACGERLFHGGRST